MALDCPHDVKPDDVGLMPVEAGAAGTGHKPMPCKHAKRRYQDCWRVEAALCRLKDFRRVGTRYDKLTANFASAIVLAALVAFWC